MCDVSLNDGLAFYNNDPASALKSALSISRVRGLTYDRPDGTSMCTEHLRGDFRTFTTGPKTPAAVSPLLTIRTGWDAGLTFAWHLAGAKTTLG